MTESQTLLARYVEDGSEAAFGELTVRYVNLVYSTAFRVVNGDAHLAQDVTQIVFVDLARAASKLPGDVMLGGWLHRHTCLVGATIMRSQRRRRIRESQMLEMNAQQDHSESNLEHVLPLLDEAINQLGAPDRKAILLRFFEQREFRSVGEALGTNEEAARKRVHRALERLQLLLKRRGVAYSAAALGTTLSAKAVVAAPAGLAASVSGLALTGAAMGSGTTIGFLNLMAMTKIKLTLVGAVLVAGVAAPLVIQHRAQARLVAQNAALRGQVSEMEAENQRLHGLAVQAKAAPPRADDQLRELLRLRGEVTRLREDSRELAALKSNASQSEMRSWQAEVDKLRKRLDQKAAGAIPEFQLLKEQDWFNAVGKGESLDTDADYRLALARLRNTAKTEFVPLAMDALAKYAAANGNQLPSDPSQLKPYFDPPVDDAILDRYKMLQSGNVADLPSPGEQVMAEKGAVDDAFDSYYTIALNGWSNAGVGFSDSQRTMDNYLNAVKAYKDAHGNQPPASSADLQPYFKQPAPPALLESLFSDGSAGAR